MRSHAERGNEENGLKIRERTVDPTIRDGFCFREARVFGLLHRSIFFELTKVFLLAFVGLTGLLLLAGVIAEATRNGLGPAQILAAIPLLIPSTIPYTVPTTTLFAVCIIYGRLAADNEILALRAAGVHIHHAILPAVALGVIASVATFVLFLDLIPYTHYILRSQMAGDVRELMYGMLKRESCIRHPKLSYEIHVTRVDGQKLREAEFRHRDGKGGYDMIALCARPSCWSTWHTRKSTCA